MCNQFSEKTYDEDQLKAINASQGRFLVLAPPGCGKTDILAERVVRARTSGVEYEDMMCLTFTNRASRGMRDRIKERLGEDVYNIFVGNVHRYCSNFLFNSAVIPENTGIIDEDDLTDLCLSFDEHFFQFRPGRVNKNHVGLIDNIDAYISQRELGQPDEAIFMPKEEFEPYYQIAKKAGLDPDRVSVMNPKVKYALKYREYKQKHMLISFSDILILAYDKIRMDVNCEYKRFKWIQVDEVQDLNALQTAIIDELTDDGGDFTVLYLGDEQQAIFSFMGAKLGQLERLKSKCGANILHLGKNYRSPKYLLDIFNTYAREVLNVNPCLLPEHTSECRPEKFDLILTGNPTVADELNRVMRMVSYYLNFDNERMAILVPTNDMADKISETLMDNNVAHFKISGIDMFQTKDYKTLAAFFSLHANLFNFAAWSRLLFGIGAKPNRIQAREWIAEMKRMMMIPADMMGDKPYIDEFHERYMNSEFVFFDTETTGLNVMEDDIVQIAAFKVRKGQYVEGSDFNIIIHTDKEIPPMLGEIPNPLIELYANSKHFSHEEGLRLFIDYIGSCPVLGHNVGYDYQILRYNTMRYLQEEVVYDCYDSLHLIKCVEPGLRMYKLEFLLRQLNLQGKNSHLANEDIMATKSLVDYCCQKAVSKAADRQAFFAKTENRKIKKLLMPLAAISDNLKGLMSMPVSATCITLVDEMKRVYEDFRKLGLIKDLGSKFDIFLMYAQNEWIDPEKGDEETILTQIQTHVNDMTASINEGDLINAGGLMTERIFVMTVHKGKGLEFENVVILSANDGVYPFFKTNEVLNARHNYSLEDVEKAEMEQMESARKFYVALSRAKKRLCISYAHENIWGRRQFVTPFIKPIAHFFRGN
jgi:DNA helicase-2/ATP-dependent DNA helicase PcrA